MGRSFAAILGAVFVAVAIAVQHVLMGRAVIGLSAGLVIAYFVWISNYDVVYGPRRRISLIYGVAVGLQGLHFLEEYLTGFWTEFPSFWGYEWSNELFATFNLVWLGIFVLAGVGLVAGVRLSYLVVWFMAIVGGIANGVLHTMASLTRGAYFPGSVTAVGHLVVGVLLIKALISARVRSPRTG